MHKVNLVTGNYRTRHFSSLIPLLVTASSCKRFLYLQTHAEKPVEVSQPLTDVTVQEEADATFTCQLSKPNQKVEWFFGGKTIKPSEKYEIDCQDCTYTLTIKNCQMKDSPADVKIKNKDCESSASLTVTGKVCCT